jgi:predicted XRE-type DNA-binding protein
LTRNKKEQGKNEIFRAVILEKEEEQMKIDAEIRHITKAGANIFLALGFPPDVVTKFTIDTLVDMLSRVGKPVKLAIG